MASLARPLPPRSALATPDKRRRRPVPAISRRFQPANDLLRCLRMMTLKCPPLEDALDGLGHIQLTATERGVERHDPMREQPKHERRGAMTNEIIEDKQQAEWRQDFG